MTEDAAVRRAVLLVGHGTVSNLLDVPEFLQRIRHGRTPPPELSKEVARRYTEIGGSPFLSVSVSVAEKLSARLGLPCHVAMRFWHPLVREVLSGEILESTDRLCVLPLSPYSVPLYTSVVREAMRDLPGAPELVPVEPYGDAPELVRAHAGTIGPLLEGRSPSETSLVMTAHSLPVSVIAGGDRYAHEFEASARAVGRELGWPVEIAYQSAGAGGGEWLGPTLADALERARRAEKTSVVVAPVGFLVEHLETLYDLDIEAAEIAKGLGLELIRVPALNDRAALVEALAAVVERAFS